MSGLSLVPAVKGVPCGGEHGYCLEHVNAPELRGITEWINSEPLTLKGLRGRVVLMQFWTIGVTFPVAFDPDYAAWNAYGKHYWPGFYVVDKHGRVRHTQFGEVEYDRAERVIQELIAESTS